MSLQISESLRQVCIDALQDIRSKNTRFVDPWEKLAREGQRLPEEPWQIAAWVTGRGYGKTRILTEFAHRKARTLRGSVGFIAARTLGDAIRTLIYHPASGLMATQKPDNPCEIKQERGQYVVKWKNGTKCDIHTSDEPDRARGPEYEWGISDEVATWKRVTDFSGNTLWMNLCDFGLRGGGAEAEPQMVVGTTPRRGNAIIKELIEQSEKPDSGVVLRRGSLLDNRENLPESYVKRLLEKYYGTSLWRQEGEGELLPEVEGALWTDELLAIAKSLSFGEFRDTVIAVDPSVTNNPGSDECGIVPCSVDVTGLGVVRGDLSGKMSTGAWAKRAVDAYEAFNATRIVAETNNGGDLVVDAIKNVTRHIKVVKVNAAVGKRARAEPVSMLYEQHRVAMAQDLPELSAELTDTDFADVKMSPNRLDAMVWGLTYLMIRDTRTRINIGQVA